MPVQPSIPLRRPWSPEPPGRVTLRTLVYIRWIAVAGQFAALLMVRYGLGFELPIVATMAVVALSAALNLSVALWRPLSTRLSERAAAFYLAYDVVQLSALLFLAGGLSNPFSLLILAPVTVSATVLSRNSTLALGALSILCITLLALWHQPFPWKGEPLVLPALYLTGIWEALVLGTLFIAIYVGSVSEEARRLSDALSETQAALSRQQRLSELGALAAAAAHELGSPLATIAVTAKEMSHDIPPDSPLAPDVELLLSQSERCRDILASLAGRRDADAGAPFTRLPVTALVATAAEPHVAEDGRLGLVGGPAADAPGSAEPTVQRSAEIVHGLGNLIQNAVQFASARVAVETRWTEEQVTVAIRDDGPGFAAGLLDRIGEPYLSTRADGTHMGLGIFIATNLLERTGARVRFRNHPAGGAEVTIQWARATIEATTTERPGD